MQAYPYVRMGVCEVMECIVCKSPLKLELTPEIKHYGKWVCSCCGRFHKWEPTPKNREEGRRKTTAVKMDDPLCCALCGRQRVELGKHETFETHHSFPLEDGGQDIRENLVWLCTACHRLAHWIRTYHYKHWDERQERIA